MSDTFDLGDQVPLAVEILNADGNPANAGSVTLTITEPDGATSTPLVSNPSAGNYSAVFTPTIPGRYLVDWVATGANAAANRDIFTVADPDEMPVISLDEAKSHLNITTDANDDELRRVIRVASKAGEYHTGRVFGRRTVSERLSGGFSQLALSHAPVLSITQIRENGTIVPASGYVLSSGTGGVVTRLSGYQFMAWHPGAYNLQVTYVAGYERQPEPDRQGALELVRHLWSTQRGTVRMMADDEWSPTMAFSLPHRTRELWDLNLLGNV